MPTGSGTTTVVVDANIVINLLHAGRLTLLKQLTGYRFVVPEDVVAEIALPNQRQELDSAIAAGWMHVVTISDVDDLTRYVELRQILGKGEAACLVLAQRHAWLIASDERGRFRREVTTRVGLDRLVNTAGLFVLGIRAGLLSIEDADAAKATLERHRFRMTFASFRDIIGGSS